MIRIRTTAYIREKGYDRIMLNKKWVRLDQLYNEGIEIECQGNGSNNPEDLEDGIFIPYRKLKESSAIKGNDEKL